MNDTTSNTSLSSIEINLLIDTLIHNLTQNSNNDCTKLRIISINIQYTLQILNKIGLAVILIGILLNILNVIVLLKTKLPESPYTYLTSLAFSDLGALTTHLLAKLGDVVFKQQQKRYIIQNLHLYFIIPLINTFLSCSMYTTLALTCERFIFVHSPLKAISVCRKYLARRICFTIFVITILKSIYLPFMYTKSKCYADGLEQINNKLIDICEFLVSLAIPYLIIFFVNISLICSLKRSTKSNFNTEPSQTHPTVVLTTNTNGTTTTQRLLENSSHTTTNTCDYRRTYNEKEHKNQRKLTISLILILCLLLICHLPSFLLEESLVEYLFGNYNTSDLAFLVHVIGTKVSIIFTYINCSANCIIYCISNKKFYNSLKHLLLKCFCTKYYSRYYGRNGSRKIIFAPAASLKYSRSSKTSVNSSSLKWFQNYGKNQQNGDNLRDSKF